MSESTKRCAGGHAMPSYSIFRSENNMAGTRFPIAYPPSLLVIRSELRKGYSPRLHPRNKLRGIRRRRITNPPGITRGDLRCRDIATRTRAPATFPNESGWCAALGRREVNLRRAVGRQTRNLEAVVPVRTHDAASRTRVRGRGVAGPDEVVTYARGGIASLRNGDRSTARAPDLRLINERRRGGEAVVSGTSEESCVRVCCSPVV